MDLYFLYLVLLGLWPPLLWPALRAKGALRLWLWVVVGLGLMACLYETRFWFGSAEAIRIDILFGAPVLAGVHAVTALLLFAANWRRFALAYASALLVLLGGAVHLWHAEEREQARFLEGLVLVAQGGFRSPEVHDEHYGPFAPAPEGLPAGHWLSDGDSLATRLIINAEGRVWLFRRLRDAETLDFVSAVGLRRAEGGDGTTWIGELTEARPTISLPPRPVTVMRLGKTQLTLTFRDRPVAFAKAPPPIDPAPRTESLSYLGSFGHVDCGPRRVEIVQLWLWRDQDGLYAVGTARRFAKGQPLRSARLMVLGAGAAEGDAWDFAWDGGRGASRARLAIEGGQLDLVLKEGSWPERRLRLQRGEAPLRGDMIDLAPRSDAEAWAHWFDRVPRGNRLSGEIPDC